MYHFVVSVNGAITLLYRQFCVLYTLLAPETDNIWTPVRTMMFMGTFLETALHVLLLISLLCERRWRSFITLWLYFGYRLAILYSTVATLTVVLNTDSVADMLGMVVVLWVTWDSTYKYVEADQKGREDQADQLARHQPAPGKAPAGLLAKDDPADRVPKGVPGGRVRLDPTGLYMVVPSYSEPPLSSVPFWEKDLDSWRGMAGTNLVITKVFYGSLKIVLETMGLLDSDLDSES